jgi:hypothetical protein
MATLTLRRDKGWADKIREYRILIDGAEVGRLGENDVLHHELSDGPHLIEARVDWCGSQPLRLEAASGDSDILVRSALRGWRVLFPLINIVFNRRGYLLLERQK